MAPLVTIDVLPAKAGRTIRGEEPVAVRTAVGQRIEGTEWSVKAD